MNPDAVFYSHRWLRINCKQNKTYTKVCFNWGIQSWDSWIWVILLSFHVQWLLC